MKQDQTEIGGVEETALMAKINSINFAFLLDSEVMRSYRQVYNFEKQY